MGHAAAAASIRERLDTLWGTTSVSWPNQKFTPVHNTSWVRPTVRFNSADQITLGSSGRKRVEGVFEVEIFVPSDTGPGVAWTYADTLGGHFQRVGVSGIQFEDYNAEEATLPEGEPWYRVLLEVPFYYDDDPAEVDELASYPVRIVTQAAHGFVVGDWVHATAGTWAKSRANASSTLSWPAVVTRAIDTDNFQVTLAGGKANVPAHGLGAQGTKLFLSQATAGLATSTEPNTGLVQQVGKVWDADHIEVMDFTPSNLS